MKLTNPKTAAVIESRFDSHAEAAENLACLLAAGEFGTGNSSEFPQSLVDAANQTVGRLATTIAPILKGKHKPTFRPNADIGDYVVIVNADKV